ncbi:MAG: hypothetical protein ACYCZ3_07080 [Thiobacillus sp.]
MEAFIIACYFNSAVSLFGKRCARLKSMTTALLTHPMEIIQHVN